MINGLNLPFTDKIGFVKYDQQVFKTWTIIDGNYHLYSNYLDNSINADVQRSDKM